MSNRTCLGVEFGSTRIKAVTIDEEFKPVSSGDFTWKAAYENGIWTYDLADAWNGLKTALRGIENREDIAVAGLSGMMHGYLVFDKDWNLLVPFRTWQNTITAQAAAQLTELFHYNIPQRWTIAHLYQAVLNNEPHVDRIAHVTSLAGYIHYRLTGVNALGIGECSGLFPVDSETNCYDDEMLAKFNQLVADRDLPWSLSDVLPGVLVAGDNAGCLTEEGAALLDGLLAPGIPFAPVEGDAGTGMTATNAIAERTGNVSAGTSIFSMVVLEKPLENVYEEIDLVSTPAGKTVAMVHGNNCTNDSNAWVGILRESAELLGAAPSTGEVFTKLYQKALEGEPDCGGVLVCNYMAGEGVTHLDEGRPMVVRRPGANFTLANFFRATLYATVATLKIGMDILAQENVAIESLTGHGGLFKTPQVGQKIMAAACGCPVTCMETAGEGGPYGMALLASYLLNKQPGETLEQFLSEKVFRDAKSTTVEAEAADREGFERYMHDFKALLEVERKAVQAL